MQIILFTSYIVLSILSLFVATYVHEIGHYLVLKIVYKESQCGVMIGDINGMFRRRFKLLGVPILIYSRPERKNRITRGLAYPWNKVYFGSRRWKVVTYAIAGAAAEFLIGVFFILSGTSLVTSGSLSELCNLVIATCALSVAIWYICRPCWKLILGLKEEPTPISSMEIQRLTNTTFGFTDARLIWERSKWVLNIYWIIAIITSLATFTCFTFVPIAYFMSMDLDAFIKQFMNYFHM